MRKLIVLGIACLLPLCGNAQSPSSAEVATVTELRNELSALKEALAELRSTVREQQMVIRKLSSAPASSSSPGVPTSVTATEGAAPTQVGGSVAPSTVRPVKQFNPDIGLVADFVASFSESREDEDGNDRLSVRHVELIFGHDVDPYGRLDATIAISDFEEAEIEEAYYSAWDLPLGLRARLGRIRPKIGYASPLHLDSLETVDEPLVVTRYLGHEGLFKTGTELSTFLPLPWESTTHEFIAGVLEGGVGEEATLLGSSSRTPTLYARLRNSADVSDFTTVDFGTTFLAGSADEDTAFEVRMVGIDAATSYAWSPLHKLRLRGELFLQDRSAPFVEEEEEESAAVEEGEDTGIPFDDSPLGAYLLSELRFAQRWSTTVRWDWVEPVNFADEYVRAEEQAWSTALSFHQSEFARWRMQYQYRLPLEGGDDHVLMLQGTFAIGNHKHTIQ